MRPELPSQGGHGITVQRDASRRSILGLIQPRSLTVQTIPSLLSPSRGTPLPGRSAPPRQGEVGSDLITGKPPPALATDPAPLRRAESESWAWCRSTATHRVRTQQATNHSQTPVKVGNTDFLTFRQNSSRPCGDQSKRRKNEAGFSPIRRV
jgi:hypothetical protein